MANWYPTRIETAVLLLLEKARKPRSVKTLVKLSKGLLTRHRLQKVLAAMAQKNLLTETRRDVKVVRTTCFYRVGPEGKMILREILPRLKITLADIKPAKIRIERRGKPRAPRRGSGGQPPP